VDKDAIIQNTVQALNALPEEKAQEIANFADFILKKYEEQTLQKGLYSLQSDSNVFTFLNEDEELYSTADIKQ
jgi:hypothetical protein